MSKKMNIGICRPAPLHIIPNTYTEKDINVDFVKGVISLFEGENIIVCSPMENEDEKILNNQKLSIKYPYLKDIDYQPYNVDMSNIDVLFIFSKDVYGKKYFLQDGISYDEHVNDLIKDFKGVIFYVQYNEVNYEFANDFDYENKKFIVLMNTNKPTSMIYSDKYYGNKDIQGYCLDLSELVFNTRISNVTNFYHKIALLNNPEIKDYTELKNVYHHLYALNKFNDGEDYDYLKNFYWESHDDFVYKLQHSTIVIVDNVSKDFYNPYYFIIANFTLPILKDKEVDFQIEMEDIYYYNEENLLEYLVEKSKAKHMKSLRIVIKDYFKNYDLKSKLLKIIEREM